MGVPIFQEQVIKLAMVAAGFTGGEADQLRRAMAAWKKNGNLAKFEQKLIDGMKARGYEELSPNNCFSKFAGLVNMDFLKVTPPPLRYSLIALLG